MKIPVNVGIEFEFAGKNRQVIYNTLKQTGIQIGIQKCYDGVTKRLRRWQLGFDGSVTDVLGPTDRVSGLEIKTPIFSPDDKTAREEIVKILRSLRSIGCFITRSSGLHIHISCPIEELQLQTKILSMLIEKHFRRFVNPSRCCYCRRGYGLDNKYVAIRSFSPYAAYINDVERNHVEIRIFNSTLDASKALKYLDRAVKYFRLSLRYARISYEVRDLQNRLRNRRGCISDNICNSSRKKKSYGRRQNRRRRQLCSS